MKKIQNYINHIAFVIDASSSMRDFSDQVITVFDNYVKRLARRSKELDQETRVSVYLFSDNVSCLIYDMDVMRLPSLKGYYQAGGMTALNDGTRQAIEDFQLIPTIYGDHSFLIYTLTDGEENRSRTSSYQLEGMIKNLPPHYTVAVLVPDQNGMHEAKRAGFPADNCTIWNVNSSKGIEEVGGVLEKTTDTYMDNRSKGIRGTKSLFKMDVNVSSATVRNNLEELDRSQYIVINITKTEEIRDCVENKTGKKYVKGSAYYQLTRPELIQGNKLICIKDRKNGKLYKGYAARNLLGLPNTNARVTPGNLSNFDIFIQSKSVNRDTDPGTTLIVLK